MDQCWLFPEYCDAHSDRRYLPILSATENRKGVMDVDTVKGCSAGMAAHPDGGCYGECYARKIAAQYGINFSVSVPRKIWRSRLTSIFFTVKDHRATWYRIGTAGDPSHDWGNTLEVCRALHGTGKTPVIITKHWTTLTEQQINGFCDLGAVFNTSTSGMDTDTETEHRTEQMDRLELGGIRSVCRVVTCQYGDTEWGRACSEKQDFLLSLEPVIDNPLRARKNNPRVISGDIIITRCDEAIVGGKFISLHSQDIFLGHCDQCPDQCGVIPAITNTQKEAR